MPSPDYKNASHDKPFGNFKNAPRMDVEMSASLEEDQQTALIWLKAARNEGTTVQRTAPKTLLKSATNTDAMKNFAKMELPFQAMMTFSANFWQILQSAQVSAKRLQDV